MGRWVVRRVGGVVRQAKVLGGQQEIFGDGDDSRGIFIVGVRVVSGGCVWRLLLSLSHKNEGPGQKSERRFVPGTEILVWVLFSVFKPHLQGGQTTQCTFVRTFLYHFICCPMFARCWGDRQVHVHSCLLRIIFFYCRMLARCCSHAALAFPSNRRMSIQA